MSDRAPGDSEGSRRWATISRAGRSVFAIPIPAVVGAALVVGGLLLGGGIAGAVGAGIAVAAWLALPVAYAVAAGAVVAIAVVPAGAPVALGLVGAGFALQLLDAARSDGPPLAASVGFLVAVVILFGVVGIALAGGAGLPIAAVAAGATGAGLVYAVHRYELVALGLVEDEDPSTTAPGTGASTDRPTEGST